jgi:hypothetical protein
VLGWCKYPACPILTRMSTFFAILAALSAIAVVGSLLFGLVAMVRSGPAARRTSNKMMQYRVLFQGIAIITMMVSLWALSQGN